MISSSGGALTKEYQITISKCEATACAVVAARAVLPTPPIPSRATTRQRLSAIQCSNWLRCPVQRAGERRKQQRDQWTDLCCHSWRHTRERQYAGRQLSDQLQR